MMRLLINKYLLQNDNNFNMLITKQLHRIMKIVILLIALVTLVPLTNLNGQARVKLPVNKHSDGFNLRGINSFLRKDGDFVAFNSIAYSTVNFLNANFASHLQDKNIKRDFGILYDFRLTRLSPLMLDVVYNYESFTIDENFSSDFAGKNILNQSFELSSSLILFPCPRYFVPYAGIGYNYSWLKQKKSTDSSENEEDEPVSVNSCPIWKAGIQSFLTDYLMVYIEYKQSVLTDKPFNRLCFGIGFSY
jgi:hypothetical protein